jgi:hypothetical protein
MSTTNFRELGPTSARKRFSSEVHRLHTHNKFFAVISTVAERPANRDIPCLTDRENNGPMEARTFQGQCHRGLNAMKKITALIFAGWIAWAMMTCGRATAAPPPSTQPGQELISLNFPENVELKILIEYVSDRLGLNILYDEQQVSQKITIRSPSQVSKASLQGLLESALAMKGLVLVDGEQPGWKRVVPLSNLAAAAATKPATMPANGVGCSRPAC